MNFQWKPSYSYGIAGTLAVGLLATYFIKQKSLLSKTCFKAAGFAPNKLTINQADINIKLKMKNKSAIDFYIKDQEYSVYINSSYVGAIKNPNRIYIAPEKTTDVWLNVKFNPMKVSNLGWEVIKDVLVKNSDIKITLKGKAKISTGAGLIAINYPVNETFKLNELLKPSQEPC